MSTSKSLGILTQTRLPEEVADWVHKCARREGISVAEWLRRMLIEERANRGRKPPLSKRVDSVEARLAMIERTIQP